MRRSWLARHIVLTVVTFLTAAHAALAQAPSIKRVKSAADAAGLLRKLVMDHQFNDGVAVGAALVKRFPRDTRVKAWYVENLGSAPLQSAADSLTAKTDTLSRDPWVLAARASALQRSLVPTRSALALAGRLARRARTLAPRDPDIAWILARTLLGGQFPGNNRFAELLAFVDSVAPTVGNPVELRVLRGTALVGLSSAPLGSLQSMNTPPDTGRRAEGFRAYAAAHAADTTNFNALYEYSARLRSSRPDEALALAKQATIRAPRSGNARTLYWSSVNAQRGMTADQKRALITADRAAYLASTDSAVWALADVANSMRNPSPEPGMAALEERILASAPRSRWAENVLVARVNQWAESLFISRDSNRPAPKPDSLVAKRRFVGAAEAFLDKGWVADSSVHNRAAWTLFYYIREDSTFPSDELVALVKRLVAARSDAAPSATFGFGSRALAQRKVELPLAEQLARETSKRVATYLDEGPQFVFSSVGEKADALDADQAQSHDDLGFVYYNEGRYDDADKELTRALDLNKKNVTIFYDLGRLRTAQGRYDDAELTFAQGMTLRYRGVNPNRKELEQLYAVKHGSMVGWTAYIAALEEKERTTRREKILGTRIKDAKMTASFRLPDLGGHIVDSDTLRGRYTVVNFWGTWCGPCVAEMPELQQFYDKYRGDPTIDILTISNDKDLQELKDWVAKRKMTIPTLFDDGWVNGTAHIQAFPTTWFVDRAGKLQFTAIGNTGALVEEWSWRLEAMRTQAAIVP